MPRYPDIERVVQRFLDAFEAGDTAKLDAIIDDTFVYRHKALDQDLDKEQFLQLAKDLHAAFPDLDLHPQLQAIGDRVDGELRLTGTHRGPFAALRSDLGVLPATGRRVALPQEHASWTVHNGKIVRHDVDDVRGGGIKGIFAQLQRDSRP